MSQFHSKINLPDQLPAYLLGLVLITVLTFGYLGYRSDTANERLFQTYFSAIPETDFSQTRALAAAEATPDSRRAALLFQQDERYDFAFEAWRAHLEQYGESDARDLLYAAANAMAVGENEQAAWYLNKISAADSDAFTQEVDWYRALLFLRTDEVASAELKLSSIDLANSTARIRRQLPELLARLEAH